MWIIGLILVVWAIALLACILFVDELAEAAIISCLVALLATMVIGGLSLMAGSQ